ncbi:hypothetical protein HQ585_04410 [candidate division KSB1 bacterium]|nr:hypothetical protein [candidate division KSB1 bacterium]
MNCRQFKRWMEKDPSAWYVDVRQALEEHQRTCESCRILWDHMQDFEDTIKECRNLSIPESVNADLWPDVFAQMTKSPVKRKWIFKPRFRLVLAWSFSTVAAVLVLWMLIGNPSIKQDMGPELDLIVDGATINGRDAQVMTFQFDEPKLSVIWME